MSEILELLKSFRVIFTTKMDFSRFDKNNDLIVSINLVIGGRGCDLVMTFVRIATIFHFVVLRGHGGRSSDALLRTNSTKNSNVKL